MLRKFFVHRYDVVRVKVAVEAEDHLAAMKAADDYLATDHPLDNKYLANRRLFSSGSDEADAERVGLPHWIHVEEPGQEITGYLVDEFGDENNEKSRTYTASHTAVHDQTEDQTDFPKADWRYDVANGDTSLGYAAWVEMNRSNEDAEAQPDRDHAEA